MSREAIKNMLENILKELESRDPDIEWSVIARADGLILASNIGVDVDRDVIAAMTASLFNIGARAVKELARGSIRRVLVEGENGNIIVMNIGGGIILSAVLKKDANLGLALLEIERAATALQDILKG